MAKKDTAKKVAGEVVEAAATGLFAGGFMSAIESLFKKGGTVLVDLDKHGRDRGDEMILYASLGLLPSEIASDEYKALFLRIFNRLITSDPKGEKATLAKGLAFLASEDKTANDPDPEKRFSIMKGVWKALFVGINNAPDKEKFLEERILLLGRNNQEGKTNKEKFDTAVTSVNAFLAKIDPTGTDDEYKGPIDQLKKTFGKFFSRKKKPTTQNMNRR